MKAFWAIFNARNKEFYRDKAGLGWNIVFPFLIIAGFAAIFGRGASAPYKLAAAPPSQEVRAGLPASLAESPFFQIINMDSLDGALAKLSGHKVDIVVQTGAGPLRYWVSESSPKGAAAAELLLSAVSDRAALETEVSRQTVQGYEVHYIDWLFPGVLAMNMMFSALFGVGYVVVRYRKDGVLKRLGATPLTAFEYLSAQVASRLLVILFSTGLVYGVCSWLFGFQCRGPFLAMTAVFLVGSAAHVSVAMVVASRGASEEFASGMLNLISWPMMFLSEVWFSLEGAPGWVKAFSQCLPLTHVTSGMRAVMNQGAGWMDVLPQMGVLAGFTAALMALGSLRFRWTPP